MSRYLPVTRRQRVFATAFVQNGGRGGDAALAASFNTAGAPGVGTRLLRNAAVLALIVGDCLRGAETAKDVLASLQRVRRPLVIRVRTVMLLAEPAAPVRMFAGRVHVMVSSDVEDVAAAIASLDGYAAGYSARRASEFPHILSVLTGEDNGLSARCSVSEGECRAASAPENAFADRAQRDDGGACRRGRGQIVERQRHRRGLRRAHPSIFKKLAT